MWTNGGLVGLGAAIAVAAMLALGVAFGEGVTQCLKQHVARCVGKIQP